MSIRTFSAVVYRDDIEGGEAAAEFLGIGDTFSSPQGARDAIRKEIVAGGWHYGSIHEGEYFPGVFGVRPARFESDERVSPWQVGLDWFEQG